MTTKISKKICMLGDFAVGKTSLVHRFIYNELYEDQYFSPMAGIKVNRKTVVMPQRNDVVELTIFFWDLAGQDDFSQLWHSYAYNAVGAALVCDLTRPETLDNLMKYAVDFRQANPAAKFIMAANKSDLADEYRLTPTIVKEVSNKLNAPYYLTSAKTGHEVEDFFRHLGRLLLT